MPIVEVPGLGVVEFPDGTSDSEMTDAITASLAQTGMEQAARVPAQVLGILTNPAAGLASQAGRAQIEKPRLQAEQREAAIQGGIAAQQAAASDYLEGVAHLASRPQDWIPTAINLPATIDKALGLLPPDQVSPADAPLISPESIDYLRKQWSSLEAPVIPPQTPGPTEQAIEDWQNQQLSGFTTPTMATALAVPAMAVRAKLPELAKQIGAGVGRGFQAQMISDVPQAITTLKDAIETGDPAQIVPASLNVAAAGGLPFLIGHGIDEPGPKVPDPLGRNLAKLPRGAQPDITELPPIEMPSREVSRERAEQMTLEATAGGENYGRSVPEPAPLAIRMVRPESAPLAIRMVKPESEQAQVRLYQGSGGVAGGGSGGSWWTTDIDRAATYGPKINYVDVPPDVAKQAQADAVRGGSGTAADHLLPDEWVRQAKELPGEHAPKIHDLEAEPAAEADKTVAEQAAADLGLRFNPEAQAGGMLLKGLTPAERAQVSPQWEFTDPKTGMTFYVPEGATREEITKRAEAKRAEFEEMSKPAEPTPTAPAAPPAKTQTIAEQIAADPNLTPEQKAAALKQGPFTRASDKAEIDDLLTRLAAVGRRAKLSDLERRALGNTIQDTKATQNPVAGRKLLAELESKYPKPPRKRTGVPAQAVLDRETAGVGEDIISWINENNRLMSRSAAKARMGERYAENAALWDDAPDKMDPVHQASIYGGGSTPDQVLKALHLDPDVGKRYQHLDLAGFWQAIDDASAKRVGARKTGEREERLLQQQEHEGEAWNKATAEPQPGDAEVTTEDLQVGDVLEVEGQQVEVTERRDDGTLVLKDGRKFGIQELEEGTKLYVEKFEPKGTGDASFGPEAAKSKEPVKYSRKRREDFMTSGVYQYFQDGDLIGQIYRDPETGWWYDEKTNRVVGFTRKEAEDHMELTEESQKLSAPEQAMPASQDLGGATPAGFAAAKARRGQKPPERMPIKQSLGSAVPEELLKEGSPVSLMFAVIDRDNAAMGREPMGAGTPRTWSEDERIALGNINRDADYIRKLLNTAATTNQPLASYEHIALVFEKAKLVGEWHNALDRASVAFDDGRLADLAKAKKEADELEARIVEIDKIAGRDGSGSEAGRRLNAQKAGLTDDLTLIEMRLERRGIRALAGQEFTPEDEQSIAAMHKEYQRLLDEQKQVTAAAETAMRKAETALAMRDVQLAAEKSAREKERIPGPIRQAAERIVKQLDADAEAARKRIRERMSRVSAGLDPTLLLDLAEVGASYIGHGILDVAEWGTKMAEDLGEWVKPHLDQIWRAANKKIQGIEAPEAVKQAIRRVKSTADPEEVISGTKEKIAAKVAKGKEHEIGTIVRRLAEAFYAQGIREVNPMIDALQSVLRGFLPDITRLETMDALSNRGKFTLPNQEFVKKGVRELSGEARLLGHITQLLEAEAAGNKERLTLPKTGPQRDKQSTKYRHLKQQLDDLMQRLGVSGGDPETQLASALQAAKRYTQNRIVDLKQEIATRERIVKTRTAMQPDAELESMRAELKGLQVDHDAIFGRRGASLEAQAAALTRTIARMEEELKTGVREQKAKQVNRPADPKLEPLKQMRDKLAKQVAEARKKPGAQKIAEAKQRQLDTINAKIVESGGKLAAGDLSVEAKPRQVNRPMEPDLEQAKLKLEEINRAIEAGRQAEAKAVRESPEKVAERAGKLLDKHIEQLEADLDAGRLRTSKTKKAASEDPANLEKEAWLSALREYRKDLADAQNPKLSPNDRKAQAARSRIATDLAEYMTRMANGDFATRTPRGRMKLDMASEMNRADLTRIRNKWRAQNKAIQASGHPRWQKALDLFYGVRRLNVLSGLGTLGRLAGYTATKLTSNIGTEAIGSLYGRIPGIRDFMDRAPIEGGSFMGHVGAGKGPIATLAHRYTKDFMQGMRDARDTATKGESSMRALYDVRERHAREWHDFAVLLHEMEKSPLKRIMFEQAMDKQHEFAIRNGVVDPKDLVIQLDMGYRAYRHAQRALLLEDNKLANGLRRMFSALEEKDKHTGRVSMLGKLGATVVKSELPILTVPSNFAKQALEGAFGLPVAAARMTRGYWVGLDQLKPEEFDAIARNLKHGSIGGAVALYAFLDGYYGWNHFGGYWQPGEKRREDDAKFGTVKVGSYNVPTMLMHHPFLEAGMLANTMGRLVSPNQKKPNSMLASVFASLFGLMEHSPLGTEATAFSRMTSGHNRTEEINKHLAGYLTPSLLKDLAKWTDPAEKRKATGILENIELGYPGLRQQVPEVQPP